MNTRRWFSPIASAAAITLLGSLTAFAVEGVTSEPAADHKEVAEAAPADDQGEDLVLEIEVDTSGDDVEGERPDDAPDNHGQTVSEFARSTDLEGCEKGHAISAVARGADPEDPQSSELYKPCKGEDTSGVDDPASTEGEELGARGRSEEAKENHGRGHAKAHGQGHAKGKGQGHAKHMGPGS